MREDALYLLRLWRDGERKEDWRASVENVRTRERKNFASLDALEAFIAERTARKTNVGAKGDPAGGKR